MKENTSQAPGPIAVDPELAKTLLVQAWENVRHIRSERISFTNVYTAVVAGGLALLQQDSGAAASETPIMTIGLVVLVLFSLVSLLSSIRLVAELRNSFASLQRVIDEHCISHLVGPLEPRCGVAARLPVRWVFPIYFGLTTIALLALLVLRLLK